MADVKAQVLPAKDISKTTRVLVDPFIASGDSATTAKTDGNALLPFEQMILRVPSTADEQIRQWNSDPNKVTSSEKTKVQEFLERRLYQFRQLLLQQINNRIEADIQNSPDGLYRMLDGIRNFIKFIAKIKFLDEAARITIIKDWSALLEELNEIVGRDTHCPDKQDVTINTLIQGAEQLTETELEDKRSTLQTGLQTKRKGLVSELLNVYLNSAAFRANKMVSVTGIGSTGKTLFIRDVVNEFANEIKNKYYTLYPDRGGDPVPNSKPPRFDTSKQLSIDQYVVYMIIDCVDLRKGGEATPKEVFAELQKAFTCAKHAASANDLVFADQDDRRFRRVAVLSIKNFDLLFMDNRTIRQTTTKPPSSFDIEQAGRLYLSDQEIAKQTKNDPSVQVSAALNQELKAAADKQEAERLAAQNPIPSSGSATPIKTAPTVTSVADGKPVGEFAALKPAVGGKTKKKIAGAVGDAKYLTELNTLLLQFLRQSHQHQVYPNIFPIFSGRYWHKIPTEVRKIVSANKIRLDLPSEEFRKQIIASEWQRMYRSAWEQRVYKMSQIMENASFLVSGLDDAKGNPTRVHNTAALSSTQLTAVQNKDLTLIVGDNVKNNSIRESWNTYRLDTRKEDENKQPNPNPYSLIPSMLDNEKAFNPDRMRKAEEWFLYYLWSLYAIDIIKRQVAPRTDEERLRNIRFLLESVRTKGGDVGKYLNRLETLVKTKILDDLGLKSLIAGYTGMGPDGFCLLETNGIPGQYIRTYLRQLDRSGTGSTNLSGKFGFGLNLEEMYMFLARLKEATHTTNLKRLIIIGKGYYNQDIYYQGCRDTANALAARIPSSEEWNRQRIESAIKDSAVTAIAQPVVFSPNNIGVVNYERSTCPGGFMDDTVLDIFLANADWWWQTGIIEETVRNVKKDITPKRDYVAFVKEWLFGDADASGLNVKVSAQCRNIARDSSLFTGVPSGSLLTRTLQTGRAIPSATGQLFQLQSPAELQGVATPSSSGLVFSTTGGSSSRKKVKSKSLLDRKNKSNSNKQSTKPSKRSNDLLILY